jgi:hypothetical protein
MKPTSNGDGPNLATMSDGELLAWMGTDATRWAHVFEMAAGRVPLDDEERRGWLIGWFANAIEAGRADR